MIHSWSQAAMWAHLRSIRVLVWASILALTALVLAFVPLFGVVAFEFAFSMAILGSLAGADLGAAFVRRLRATDCAPLERATDPVHILLAALVRAQAVNLALLVPPLVIMSLNALKVRNCDWWFGLQAYVLLPGLSSLVATTIGVLLALAVGNRRKLSNALPFVVLFGSFFYAVWKFYSEPPVFSYNMFAGYYPGSLYDEAVAFAAPFYWARFFQLALLAALVGAAAVLIDVPSLRLALRPPRRPAGLRLRAALISAASAVLALALWLESGSLGFSIDADFIKRDLGGRYESEHFVIYFPPGGEIERDIDMIAEDHEFRYAQVSRTLGAEVSGKITSYYFATPEQKFHLMGARKVYMAKPWRNEIYLHHYPFPHRVLRHELAHVVAGVFGDRLFHVSVDTRLGLPLAFNVGLIEGLAVAADWPDHRTRLTPHQAVKAMFQLGVAPPVDRIFSTAFLTFSSARSYTLAGSFVRFLLETRGADRLRVLYRTGGDFRDAYGLSRAQLAKEWRSMIEATEIPADAAEVVRERFRRPSLFKRPCPHAIMRRRGRAADLAGRGRMSEAIAAMETVCSDSPQEPRYRYELALLRRRSGASDRAAALFSEIAGNAEEISSTLRAKALMQLAAMAMDREESAEAIRALEEAAALPLDEDTKRNVLARLFVARHSGPAGPALEAYFWGSSLITGYDMVVLVARAAEAVSLEPGLGLGYYLLGRATRSRGAPDETSRLLEAALDRGLPNPLLARECARLLAESAYLADKSSAVLRAASILTAPDQPEATRLYGRDWLERLHWKRTGELLPAE